MNEVILILQQQNILIVIKELFFTDFTPLLYEVISDFDHLVQIVDMSIRKTVQIRFHSTDDFSIFDLKLIKHFFLIDFIEGEELVSFVFLVFYAGQDDDSSFLIIDSEIQNLGPLVLVLIDLGFAIASKDGFDQIYFGM